MSSLTKIIFQPRLLMLGGISFFTDVSSEMLYPILPFYLISVGFSAQSIGLLEGIAEVVVSLSKGFFGSMSDRLGKRLPFIRTGYAISNLTRPLIGLSSHPLWIFLQRLGDRFGKGLRTGARDAMLAESVPSENRGIAFGFHRTLDTLGAVAGPLVATFWLTRHPGDYRSLFFIAFIPGAITMVIAAFLKETPKVPSQNPSISLVDKILYWKRSSASFKRASILLLFFAFLSSSHMFFILMLKSHGIAESEIVTTYMLYNVVYAGLAIIMGKLADDWGSRPIVSLGIACLTFTFAGFSIAKDQDFLRYLFIFLGFTSACVEGNTKAWLSQLVDKADLASALGGFAALSGLAILLGNVVMGILWETIGHDYAFRLFALLGASLFIALFIFRKKI
ncbi:MAG: MFS transporter [Bacteriovoracaceae bacterium]|nr:MFS transporter [Bacteriovoracaceae bacterium]